MLKICPVVITCPERKNLLKSTLKSFKESDLPTKPKVFSLSLPNKIQAQIQNAKNALLWANGQECDYVLFCEDDIEVNKFIVYNLSRWLPVKFGFSLIATLFDNLRHVPGTVKHNYCQLVPSSFGDSQCILIKKAFLPFVLENWEGKHHPNQLHGFRIYHSLFNVNSHLFVHNPSLVQHTGKESSWQQDNRFFTTAESYRKDWKAQ